MRTCSGLATTTTTNEEDNVGSTAIATVPITSSTITPPRKRAPKKQRLKRVNLCARGADRVRVTATINGALDLPYCADSGSEYNIISQELVQKLRAVDNGVELVELVEHVEVEAVGGAILTATHAVDVRLTLNTAAGPVRCQDRKRCLVVGSDDDELIVGRTPLAELDIDVDRELEQLAARSSSGDDLFCKSQWHSVAWSDVGC
ncbi:hypothetical protein PHMEG_00022322 [Phytophthora megakarya]|uniref:Uncharacterized protein n=1 Tax=Phytophthora megakarya TaxID=4795 RepID=A0A225VKD9_9STRA|nr:hypothetical protein PHMEG_00022322 [Phytophthora megakarya]